jgi:hypothetical protein
VTPLYLTAVGALAEQETSLGALALIRPLIETWAHMYFIMDDDELADASCRAIRLEVGWAHDTLGLARVSGSTVEVDTAQRRLNDIEAIRKPFRMQRQVTWLWRR